MHVRSGLDAVLTITESFALPGQPAAGSNEFIPLGGNGFTAPQSAFLFDMQITGDASGGLVNFTINRDDRFEHIVSFLQIGSNNAAAIDYIMGISRKQGVTFQNVGKTKTSGVTGSDLAVIIWAPPPMIEPISWLAVVANTDLELFKFKGLVYNFNIRASEETPIAVLQASVPRSPSAV